MSCSIHPRVFLVALCLVSMSIAFESLLARELSSQLTPRALHRSSPPQLIDTYQSPILLNHDVPVETDNYAGVLLRAILNAPHSWELIVKRMLHSLTFWVIVGVTTLFHHVDHPSPGLSTTCQHLSYFATHFLSARRARVALPAPVTLTLARVFPPPLLVTVSSTSLSLPSKRHFRRHRRSPSRVTEITF